METDRILIDPHIKGNKPCIRGTRIPVECVLEELAAGHTLDQLAESFQVTREDIASCIGFAHKIVHNHWRQFLAHPDDLEEE